MAEKRNKTQAGLRKMPVRFVKCTEGCGMSYTLREIRGVFVPIAIWGLATVFCTIAGPFGTQDALGIGARFGYWGGIAAASVLGALLCQRAGRPRNAPQRVGLWAGFVVLLSGLVHVVNVAVFDDWQGWGQFFYLLGIIAVTVLVVRGVIGLARGVFGSANEVQPPDPQAIFLRRIPLDKRAPLVRLEAQDHYLRVVTDVGDALILMRLQDAMHALAGAEGMQVHRSHWVATKAIAAHKREQGRDLLVLSNGDEIPISRSFRSHAKQAGLI